MGGNFPLVWQAFTTSVRYDCYSLITYLFETHMLYFASKNMADTQSTKITHFVLFIPKLFAESQSLYHHPVGRNCFLCLSIWLHQNSFIPASYNLSFCPTICDKLLWVCIILSWFNMKQGQWDPFKNVVQLHGGQGHCWSFFQNSVLTIQLENHDRSQISIGHKCLIFCSLAKVCRSTCYWTNFMMDCGWVWTIRESLGWANVK